MRPHATPPISAPTKAPADHIRVISELIADPGDKLLAVGARDARILRLTGREAQLLAATQAAGNRLGALVIHHASARQAGRQSAGHEGELPLRITPPVRGR